MCKLKNLVLKTDILKIKIHRHLKRILLLNKEAETMVTSGKFLPGDAESLHVCLGEEHVEVVCVVALSGDLVVVGLTGVTLVRGRCWHSVLHRHAHGDWC